jgi:serine/threonine-protein kinase SRK2
MECDDGNESLPDLSPTYHVLREIGRGNFGNVVLARDVEQDMLVAIKLLQRGPRLAANRIYVGREILHHGSLLHPFVITLYGVFLTRDYVCIVMELADHGDVFTLMRRKTSSSSSSSSASSLGIGEEGARYLFQQLIIGLDYVHRSGVANRDLKLENLLLARATDPRQASMLKICDFGFSKHEQNSSARSGVGTPMYMSPEIVMGGCGYDAKKADVWSAGVVLYTMLAGSYPFDTKSPTQAQDVVLGRYIPLGDSISSQAQDLVRMMLTPSPKERASVSDIMQHEWFKKGLPENTDQINSVYLARNKAIPDDVIEKVEKLMDVIGRPGQCNDDTENSLACVFHTP